MNLRHVGIIKEGSLSVENSCLHPVAAYMIT